MEWGLTFRVKLSSLPFPFLEHTPFLTCFQDFCLLMGWPFIVYPSATYIVYLKRISTRSRNKKLSLISFCSF